MPFKIDLVFVSKTLETPFQNNSENLHSTNNTMDQMMEHINLVVTFYGGSRGGNLEKLET